MVTDGNAREKTPVESGATRAHDPGDQSRERRAERLKERIYLTFTALAVVLTLSSGGDVTAESALRTLVVTIFGSALAMFLAELLSHIVLHRRGFHRDEVVHTAATLAGAVSVVLIPILLVGAASLGLWSVPTALRVSRWLLVVWLIGIGFLAVRRLPISRWQRVVVLLVEAAIGLAVVALQLLAHH